MLGTTGWLRLSAGNIEARGHTGSPANVLEVSGLFFVIFVEVYRV